MLQYNHDRPCLYSISLSLSRLNLLEIIHLMIRKKNKDVRCKRDVGNLCETEFFKGTMETKGYIPSMRSRVRLRGPSVHRPSVEARSPRRATRFYLPFRRSRTTHIKFHVKIWYRRRFCANSVWKFAHLLVKVIILY